MWCSTRMVYRNRYRSQNRRGRTSKEGNLSSPWVERKICYDTGTRKGNSLFISHCHTSTTNRRNRQQRRLQIFYPPVILNLSRPEVCPSCESELSTGSLNQCYLNHKFFIPGENPIRKRKMSYFVYGKKNSEGSQKEPGDESEEMALERVSQRLGSLKSGITLF